MKAFVDSHVGLQESVDRARQEIADAVKAVEERDRNRSKAKSSTVAKPTGTSADESSKESPLQAGSLSLFDSKTDANDVSQDTQ